MRGYLLLYRLRRPVKESETELGKLRAMLPEDSRPVFFGEDSGAMAFKSAASALDLFGAFDDRLRFVKDWAIIEVGTEWVARDTHGPLQHWFKRHRPPRSWEGPG